MSVRGAGGRLFGTDGIRGRFGAYPLDERTVTRLGALLATRMAGEAPPTVVLGGDTRASTPELCGWLAAGLRSAGARCRYAGTLPTPGVAYLTHSLAADCGIAVSASHNPMPDNGIKLIDGAGFKWPTDAEHELELALVGSSNGPAIEHTPEELLVERDLEERYRRWLAGALPGEQPLEGLKVVVDAANGAASRLAGPLFAALGATVDSIFDRPDGDNINRGCGSTHPGEMLRRVIETASDVGFAFDGDADRVLFSDETGSLVDGDATLYLWALALLETGELVPPRVVATSMSNLGLEVALRREGIEVVRCDVGDRAVVETMRREGIALGGEQSGHIVHLGLGTTGDGLLTALQVAAILRRGGAPASEQLAGFQRFPQVLKNVGVTSKPDLESLPRVAAMADSVRRRLDERGRLVLRYSGTEPLARVMIEGPDAEEIEALADELLESIRSEIGGAQGGAA